jgi:DNA adenine methylase
MSSHPAGEGVAARPVLKWAGGKTQLLREYDRLFPRIPDLATYHEPFVGSGAVFFHLRSTGAVPGRAILSDLNDHLMTTHAAVRDQPTLLAGRVAALAARHSDESYYAERERFNAGELGPLDRAALVVYLNKAGFNGLFRVNRSGAFNVPVGRSAKGSGLAVPSLDAFLAASRALQSTDLLTSPFAAVLDRARPGDFIYFDPPYVPVSQTASFTAYACEGFGRAEQELLRDIFVQLDRRGCRVMLSNSGNLEVLALYRGFDVTTLSARRSINSKIDARGPVTEVVIRNYS